MCIFLCKFFPNNDMLKRMTDRVSRDYSHGRYTSYNAGTLIPSGRQGPPPPMMTQFDPNTQVRQVVHGRGQFTEEKNIVTHNPYPEALNGQRPMTIVAPTYDQHIIKPPKANVTHGRIPDIEIICSEDRNFTTYPDSCNYVIKLKDIYKNVTSVTLFNACIPNTAYLIGRRNNLIYFRESICEKLVAEIPVGDYNPTDLVNNIQAALNAAGDSTYTVILDGLTNKFTIKSNLAGGEHIFSLDFYGCSEPHDNRTRAVYPPRSIGKVIGFSRQNFLYASGKAGLTSGSTSIIGNSKTSFLTEFSPGDTFFVGECNQIFTVVSVASHDEMVVTPAAACTANNVCLAKGSHTAPNKFDLSSDAFVILDILELENVRSNSTPIDRAFAIVPMVFPHNTKNFVVSPVGGVPPYIKHFNPPLARLDRLTIQFKDIDGNLINFNGIENFMEFRIHTINASGKYDPGVLN